MNIFNSIVNSLREQWHYRRARAELAVLDDRILQDIGIARGDIDYIARMTGAQAVAQRQTNAPDEALAPQFLRHASQH